MGDGEPEFETMLVEPDPIFTPEQIREDGRSRVAKTGGQVGGAFAVVGLGASYCRYRGWLHGELDPIGFGEWVTLVSIVASGLTNWRRLRGKS